MSKNIRGVGFGGIILCNRRDAPWHVSCDASLVPCYIGCGWSLVGINLSAKKYSFFLLLMCIKSCIFARVNDIALDR